MADAAACDGGAREGGGVCGEEPEVLGGGGERVP